MPLKALSKAIRLYLSSITHFDIQRPSAPLALFADKEDFLEGPAGLPICLCHSGRQGTEQQRCHSPKCPENHGQTRRHHLSCQWRCLDGLHHLHAQHDAVLRPDAAIEGLAGFLHGQIVEVLLVVVLH